VDNYNQFRERLGELTAYDVETDTRSILTGDGAALRLDSELSALLSGRFAAAGPIQSLAEVGVNFNSDGTLSFNASEFKAKYAADPEAVEQFFTTDEFGVSARFDKLIESLSGDEYSLLSQRIETLQDKIALNESRIEHLNDLLASQQEQLLMQFYRMEAAIGKMQSSLSALEAIQPLTPLATAKKE
jgi:flagellar hook-associated protein 2